MRGLKRIFWHKNGPKSGNHHSDDNAVFDKRAQIQRQLKNSKKGTTG